ncbi:MAG: hypothetical protein AAFX87_04720 [Bacteroidota bacterium]
MKHLIVLVCASTLLAVTVLYTPASTEDLQNTQIATTERPFVHHVEFKQVLAEDCQWKDIALHGKVQFVDKFPDIKIQYVKSFPDIKVKFVDSFPNDCGEWQEVNSFPDFKIQVVESFSDLKVQEVTSFPGMN